MTHKFLALFGAVCAIEGDFFAGLDDELAQASRVEAMAHARSSIVCFRVSMIAPGVGLSAGIIPELRVAAATAMAIIMPATELMCCAKRLANTIAIAITTALPTKSRGIYPTPQQMETLKTDWNILLAPGQARTLRAAQELFKSSVRTGHAGDSTGRNCCVCFVCICVLRLHVIALACARAIAFGMPSLRLLRPCLPVAFTIALR